MKMTNKQTICKVTIVLILLSNVTLSSFAQSSSKKDSLFIKPVLTIAGYKSGNIPLKTIRQANNFTIDSQYKIKDLIVYASGPNFELISCEQKTEQFNVLLMNILQRITVGGILTIDRIKVGDKLGKVFNLESVVFQITN